MRSPETGDLCRSGARLAEATLSLPYPSRQTTADPKTRALIESIREFEWHIVRSEAEAVLFEGRLIRDFVPNTMSASGRQRFLLVGVNPDNPWPRFQLTRVRKDDGARYFGPFADSGALPTTLGAIRKKFGIRSVGRRFRRAR